MHYRKISDCRDALIERMWEKYDPASCIVFSQGRGEYSSLHNMSNLTVPLLVNNIEIASVEHLYQALKFLDPQIQKKILEQEAPYLAKELSKKYFEKSARKDWIEIQEVVMDWCIRVRLFYNWDEFSKILLSTGNLPIVQESLKTDFFWSAIMFGREGCGSFLTGINSYGNMLVKLRENLKNGKDKMSKNFMTLLPPSSVKKFHLNGVAIGEISRII